MFINLDFTLKLGLSQGMQILCKLLFTGRKSFKELPNKKLKFVCFFLFYSQNSSYPGENVCGGTLKLFRLAGVLVIWGSN